MNILHFLSTILVAAVTAAATVFSGMFGYLNTDRSHDIEMVRISLQILQGESTKESLPGRQFALRTLAKYSQTEIPTEEFDVWAKEGTLPRNIATEIEKTNKMFFGEVKEYTDLFSELEKKQNADVKTQLMNNIEKCEQDAANADYSDVDGYSRFLQSCLLK